MKHHIPSLSSMRKLGLLSYNRIYYTQFNLCHINAVGLTTIKITKAAITTAFDGYFKNDKCSCEDIYFLKTFFTEPSAYCSTNRPRGVSMRLPCMS